MSSESSKNDDLEALEGDNASSTPSISSSSSSSAYPRPPASASSVVLVPTLIGIAWLLAYQDVSPSSSTMAYPVEVGALLSVCRDIATDERVLSRLVSHEYVDKINKRCKYHRFFHSAFVGDRRRLEP